MELISQQPFLYLRAQVIDDYFGFFNTSCQNPVLTPNLASYAWISAQTIYIYLDGLFTVLVIWFNVYIDGLE